MNRVLLSLAFIIVFSEAIAQQNPVDSLLNLLKKARHDTVRLKLKRELGETIPIFRISYWDSLQNDCRQQIEKSNEAAVRFNLSKLRAVSINNIGFIYDNQGDAKKAIEYYQKSLKIQEEVNDKEGLALSLNNIGSVYLNQGKDAVALDFFSRSLALQEEIKDKKGMAYSLINIGGIYNDQGNIPKALEYFHRSLKINEELKDLQAIAYSLSNVGAIYNSQGELELAIESYNRCLELRRKVNDQIGVATSLNKLGKIYQKQKKYKLALDNFNQSLKIQEELMDKHGMVYSLNNIGTVYLYSGDPDCVPAGGAECLLKGSKSAFGFFIKSLNLSEEIGDKSGLAESLSLLSSALISQGKYKEAESFAERSLRIAKELGFPENIKNAALNLKKIYQNLGKSVEALQMFELYIAMKDSLISEQSKKETQRQQFKYEWEKRESQIKADQEKKDSEASHEKHKQQLILTFVIIGLIIVVVFSIFLYNRFRLTNRQKGIIEEKNKEITDSIHYASRIQRAMLTSSEYISKNLPAEHFILYQPKDIVSGDFYWATAHAGSFYVVTADCTGHGVPGAFMSLLNINLLHENIVERNIREPKAIFNNQRQQIIKALNPNGTENSKDGMDCTLCKYDFENKGDSIATLTFSSANNSIYLIRNKELTEYKPDKMPVGLSGQEDKSFSQKTVELKRGDSIYTFTDGYADQFGGPNGKKFMYKRFKEFLVEISGLPLQEQKERLDMEMKDWKKGQEQIDDILVIGVRV